MSVTPRDSSTVVRRASIIALAVVPFLAACGRAEAKRIRKLAGDYVYLDESEIPPGQQQPWIIQENTLTLRVDGRWKFARVLRVSGKLDPHSRVDSGTFRLAGTTLVLSATANEPITRYTISGDTLWLLSADRARLAERVTGVKMDGGGDQAFLARRR